MVIFHSYVSLPEGIWWLYCNLYMWNGSDMTLDVDTPMRGRTEVIDEFGACTHTQVAYILYI